MADAGRTIHIRLSPRLQEKLETLHKEHFAGLPVATVAKLLLAGQLLKTTEALVAVVQEQIRTPTDETRPTAMQHRFPGTNTSKRKRE